MKDYKKFIKKLMRDSSFELKKTTRKSTVKLVYIPTNEMYSIHPGDAAIRPLKNWIKRLKK